MRKFIIAASLLVGTVVLADRTMILDSNRVTTHTVHLSLLPDAGCSIEACATVLQKDAGVGYSGCAAQDLAGAARTRCLSVLSDADALWKSREGL